MRCSDLLCSPSSNANNDLIANTPVFDGGATFVEIEPSVESVYLIGVTLTPVA